MVSKRGSMLLQLIDARSDVDWSTGKVERFWVPRAGTERVDRGRDLSLLEVHVSGSGDMRALKALERAGLIRRPKTTIDIAYVVTEDGRVEVERIREAERAAMA